MPVKTGRETGKSRPGAAGRQGPFLPFLDGFSAVGPLRRSPIKVKGHFVAVTYGSLPLPTPG